jgi:AraC-like DNA-binding protein
MSRTSKTVAAAIVRTMASYAGRVGISPEEFTVRTGVRSLDLSDPGARIGRTRYARVLALVCPLDDPRYAIHEGSVLGLYSRYLPLLVGAWLNARTKRVALEAYLRYRPILGESDAVCMLEKDHRIRFEYQAEGSQEFAAHQASGNFQMIAEVVRHYDQGRPTSFLAELTRPLPRFSEFLGGNCVSSPSTNALEFQARDLDDPYPCFNAALSEITTHALEEQLASLEQGSSLALAVERALTNSVANGGCFPDSGPILEQLCADMGMSRWTLHRKLMAEGTTFRDIWMLVRVREARRLLLESSLSMNSIGDRLGFGSQASFTRFFARALGVSPLECRSRGLDPSVPSKAGRSWSSEQAGAAASRR